MPTLFIYYPSGLDLALESFCQDDIVKFHEFPYLGIRTSFTRVSAMRPQHLLGSRLIRQSSPVNFVLDRYPTE